MLYVCVQDALAATLVDEGLSLLDAHCGPPPNATEVWLDDRDRSQPLRWCPATAVWTSVASAGSSCSGGLISMDGYDLLIISCLTS